MILMSAVFDRSRLGAALPCNTIAGDKPGAEALSGLARAQTNSAQSFLVRSTSVSGPSGGGAHGLLSATSRREQLQQDRAYSITSSASNCIEVGTARPSALAVFMLITSSNLVGCSTGNSLGCAPQRMRPAKSRLAGTRR
jgi:hypothetical protein